MNAIPLIQCYFSCLEPDSHLAPSAPQTDASCLLPGAKCSNFCPSPSSLPPVPACRLFSLPIVLPRWGLSTAVTFHSMYTCVGRCKYSPSFVSVDIHPFVVLSRKLWWLNQHTLKCLKMWTVSMSVSLYSHEVMWYGDEFSTVKLCIL